MHGLAFGPDGALYAGDIMGSTVHRVDAETGYHRAAVQSPLGLADDVAFAPEGTPYAGTMVWTGVAVGKLYAKAPGGEPRVLADNLPSINTVGFAPDGRLYATQVGRSKTLWSVDLSSNTPPRKLWDDTGGLNGFVIAPDGYLYGPRLCKKWPHFPLLSDLGDHSSFFVLSEPEFAVGTIFLSSLLGLGLVVDTDSHAASKVKTAHSGRLKLFQDLFGTENVDRAPEIVSEHL